MASTSLPVALSSSRARNSTVEGTVELSTVRKCYGDFVAVDDLSLAIQSGLLVLCARIYRIGILIYGKRPNLPEIVKWLKYAKT